MFKILQDSIFNPKGLIKQVNRSGWFTFFFLFVMALFMSIGTFVALASYPNPTFTETSVGCYLEEGSMVCDGENYDIESLYYVYGFRVYFLDSDMTINDIPDVASDCLIIQDDSVTFYVGNTAMGKTPIFGLESGNEAFQTGINSMTKLLLVTSIFSDFITNFLLILSIVLISSLMFIRYKKYILYKKLFKLVTFAITPVALLVTFYNLITFPFWVFFLVSVFAYRTLFILNKELYVQMILRQAQDSNQDPNVVESYKDSDLEDKSDDSKDDEE